MESKVQKLFIFFFFVFHLLVFCSSSFSTASNTEPTVYELLPKYGLPSGLLPDSVTNYTLDQDGNFEGIEVQRFFFWFNVDEIKVDLPPSGSIYFNVGIINKKLDVDQFLTVRSCKDKAFTLKQWCSFGNHNSQLPVPRNYAPVLLAE
ncbi:uncharacterized protein [Henckelia pumila]|uniref:uncharacterized protein isoform X3 n=1 Tax=Henckelia pumila TaxID=405737 RepID=UPI003C6E2763